MTLRLLISFFLIKALLSIAQIAIARHAIAQQFSEFSTARHKK
jgi:hypothetical protein